MKKTKNKKKTVAAFPRNEQKKFARMVCNCETLSDAIAMIRKKADDIGANIQPPNKIKTGSWFFILHKLADGLEQKKEVFSIFVSGNSKLPFWAFSVLPEITCPGAGECLKFCYSFKAWQYPSAFARQIQNTLFLKFCKRLIIEAFKRLKWADGDYVKQLRLYVDGDIDSIETLLFWWNLLRQRPDVSAYGYSKSFDIFIDADRRGIAPPANYVVNLSSGSKYENTETKKHFAGLPVVRGEFTAIHLSGDAAKFAKTNARYDDPDYYKAMREEGKKQGYTRFAICPGKCGDCGNGKPFCAGMDSNGQPSASLQGLPILNIAH